LLLRITIRSLPPYVGHLVVFEGIIEHLPGDQAWCYGI